jgi:cell division septum initiation protein DivIVA
MAFGLQKLAVLESKLGIYEDLSKEMLDKLERAVDKISQGNNQIAQVLARHEEKLDQSERADELLLKMMEEVKNSNSKEHAAVIKRIETVETRVNDLATFRWVTVS